MTRDDIDAVIAASTAEEAITLAFLQQAGPPVRLRVLCEITGFSRAPFVEAIERGELNARLVGRGRGRYLVDRHEAIRYLRAIKFAA